MTNDPAPSTPQRHKPVLSGCQLNMIGIGIGIGIGAAIFLIMRMPEESATCSPAPGGRRAGSPSQDQPQSGRPHRPPPRRTIRKCFHCMENTHARPGPAVPDRSGRSPYRPAKEVTS